MKKLEKLSLKKEVDREAADIRDTVSSRDNLDDISVSEDMETSLFNKIQEYEYDKRFHKTVRRSKKRRRICLALAAAIILVCGSVMTGTGSKSYWKVLWERIAGEEKLSYIDVENMDSHETEDLDEVQVFKDIKNEIGIYPVRFGYLPEDMIFKRFEIDKAQARAALFYTYNKKTIKYSMYMNDADSSYGQIEPDQLVEEYQTEIRGITINIKKYLVEESDQERYIAEFEYMDAQYEIKGMMEKDKFEKIINNLIFYDENA
ncbi:MAG TPA: DUF4367 domain-containing protein [Candidatus Mediterraneibacter merdipullorum]|nr:DUF4367 domain-containing protein [Candidatus Mediterraneibacter merdipullorum]